MSRLKRLASAPALTIVLASGLVGAAWAEPAASPESQQGSCLGKAALRGYVEGALAIPGFHITWASSEAHLSPDARMAYVLSTNAVTLPGPAGQAVTTRGRALTVWRREPDGEWRCAIDIWNDGPPEP